MVLGPGVGLLTIALLAACAPTTATVSGTVKKNSSAANFQEISLVQMLENGEEKTTVTTTDNLGGFRFEDVAPGKYYLLTSFSIVTPQDSSSAPSLGTQPLWQQPMPQPFGLTDPLGIRRNPGTCTSEGGAMGILTVLGSNDAGDNVAISVVSNSEEPFELQAGDELEKDIVVYCH